MRGPDLARPFTGVRTVEPAITVMERCRAYQARMRPSQFFSHQTAASIHGIPLPRRCESGPIHVSSPGSEDAPRTRGVIGHTVRPGLVAVVTVDGLPVVSPVEAWCQLATALTIDELVIAGDRLLARKEPLCSREEIESAVRAFEGRRGVRKLRAAATEIRPRVDSPKESELRLALVRSGLPEPAVNIPIVDRRGARIALGDLVYEQYKVLVEYDGEQHRLDDRQYARDVERLESLASERWTVVRILQRQMPSAAHRVRSALTDAGWRP
jgi:very-short-patch-repair endonuclease